MRTADGTKLDADIWMPDGPGPHPVLLMRQPYGRRIASTLVYAHPAWYAAQGYMVAVQDVRGTGSSEGAFRLFEAEEADGAEAVAWAADLPGSNGRVGMYGFSYQGNTQLLALAGGARPRALAPSMVGWDLRTDWAWEGGAPLLAAGVGWGVQMGWLRAMHDGDAEAAAAFQGAARTPPLNEPGRAMPDVMGCHGHLTHYPTWLSTPGPAPYWDRIAPRVCLQGHALDVPMLHIGGWYDQMLIGTLDCHAAASHGPAPQRLLVGPWMHQPWGRKVGAVDFGPAASSPVDAAQVAWFDRHLRDRASGPEAGLALFDLGQRQWREFSEWPEVSPQPLFLGGSGRAAATTWDGTLAGVAGPAGADFLVHDPWRPVPTLGGHVAQPGGMQDRAALDDRADVACFTSDPLTAPLFLCGRVQATLWAGADQPSFDLSVTLAMVAPDGRVWNLTQGYRRVAGAAEGAGEGIVVGLRAVCATVTAGHAIRLSIAGACFPGYPVNPGTGDPADRSRAADERPITLRIRHGGATPSHVTLPAA